MFTLYDLILSPRITLFYESGEQSRIDHLVFVVHGIGAHHDLSFRSLVDCGESLIFSSSKHNNKIHSASVYVLRFCLFFF